ncbi:MAG: LysR family transcriptional regulator [Myxococcota bacterium]
MQDPLPWDDLQLVLAVARAGSATAAAKATGSSPSTVTRRIARLEASLGAVLFRRQRDGLQPTEAGARVVAAATRMAAELERLSLVADDALEGLVRVATTEGLAALLVTRGLCDLCRRNPGLRIELLGGNAVADLGAEADLAVRVRRPTEPDARARCIATLDLALCASAAYPRRAEAPLVDLAGHDVVLPSGSLAGLPEARWLAAVPGVRVVLQTSSMVALEAAVRAGVGLGVIPRGWAALDPAVRVLRPVAVPPRQVWLAVAPEAAGRAAVRAVAREVERIAAGAMQPASGGAPARGVR